jgi:nitroreductase
VSFFSESFDEVWRARYGAQPDFQGAELGALLAHRSVRKFAETPITDEVLQSLILAAQSASTSSNLQLWSVISVQDPVRREAITKLCADQDQVRNAPVFLAVIADLYRVDQAARVLGFEPDGPEYMEFLLTAVIDASLAAERLVCAAETLGIGTCYIGALRNHPEKVKELLNLPHLTFGTFGLCLGYPHESESGKIKPRLVQDAVWFKEQYDQSVSVSEYDLRMEPFFASRKMETTWSMQTGKRLGMAYMAGRAKLLDFLQSQGLAKK